MGSLIVRNVENELIDRLKSRAASHRRSAEAEHREILRQALTEGSPAMPFGALQGRIRISADFDDTPQDIVDAVESGSP